MQARGVVCLVLLGFANVTVCEWWIGCVGWRAHCLGIELSAHAPRQWCIKNFLCFEWIPVFATYCKGMVPLVDPFLPWAIRLGEGHRSSACAPCIGMPFGVHLAMVPRLLLDVSDTEHSVGLGSLHPWRPISSVLSLDMYDCCARCRSPCAVPALSKECYLVDPASSHMLVSKIKPCMCKYELIQTVKLRMAH